MSAEETGTLPADGVRRMFDRIAPVYDVMNRTMTAGLDRRWRRLTAEAAVHDGDDVLDACAVAWTAHRHAVGEARSLPDPPEVFSDGIPAAIVV